MSSFGTLTLVIALVVATYGGVASVIGARRKNPRLVESGRSAAYALAGVLGLSSVAMVYAFLSNDYSIRYVQRYSESAQPLFYKITAYWGGLDGSILWWAFLLSVFGAIAIYTNRHRHKEIMPYVVATLMAITNFFLYLIIFHKNPFDTFLTSAPATGEGLNPLLQNAYMVTHPPSLYIGLVGMAIPYAFAMGALVSGHLDDAWIAAVRKWTLVAWFFLAMGLTLGMLWAYEELGWGGFWAWDPVENAGFLPWLTGTAFLHSVMIQERRGMMKVWNFTLIILTFFLTIFGTFMTRSGVVQSVHAFGQDTKLAWIFAIFMALTLAVSFGFVIARLPELRARGQLDSWLSREAAFLVNNWILLFSAFFVLFATMFPTIAEALGGERITVGPPFFNKWMIPIGLALLFLTGVGPLIAWRKATASHLRYQFAWPLGAMAVTIAVCLAVGLGAGGWAPVLCFGLSGFVVATIVQEFARGTSVRRRNTGSDAMTAFLGMVLRGRRRYGGYVVHAGIVLMFIGFAGQAYKQERETRLLPGQEETFGRYTIKFAELLHEEDRQKEMITGDIRVLQDGHEIARLRPARWHFHKRPGEPTTEVAIRRSLAEDLYVTLGNYDMADGSGLFKLTTNPLVDWIWLGFVLLALGTGIALLPEVVFAPLANRAGVGASDGAALAGARGGAALSLLGILAILAAILLSLFVARRAFAAGPDRAADEKWLTARILCTCGCRRPLNDCGMPNCGGELKGLARIRELLDQGKSRDEIVAIFIRENGGQHILAEPLDQGVNRLAWALPYGLGLAGATALGLAAWRFARRKPALAAAGAAAVAPPADPELEERLDDELSRTDV